MILFLISLFALIYSLSIQGYQSIKKATTPTHKKTPEYKEFKKQLNNILSEHKVNHVMDSSL